MKKLSNGTENGSVLRKDVPQQSNTLKKFFLFKSKVPTLSILNGFYMADAVPALFAIIFFLKTMLTDDSLSPILIIIKNFYFQRFRETQYLFS